MWNNKGKTIHRSANIKSYLGGFHSLNVAGDEIDNNVDDYGSQSSRKTKTVACSIPNAKSMVSVLVEIPEELDIARFPSRYEEDAGRFKYPTTKGNQQQSRRSVDTNDSAAVVEIGNNLMDLDNYILSVFHMNDDASVYTKATTDTNFSSSNSSSSTSSTRRRHRGASRNRRGENRRCNNTNRIEKGCNWLESMKKSSMNIFVDGEDGWTPTNGWRVASKKSTWDLKPDRVFNDRDPIFDSIKKERLEI